MESKSVVKRKAVQSGKRLSEGLVCEHLKNDGSCEEPTEACCIAWCDWDANSRTREPAAYFCNLPKKQRDAYGE